MVTGLDSGRLSTAGALTLLLLALTSLIGSSETVAPTDEIASDRARAVLARESSPDSGCTVVYAADESGAFGGNNEDERNPLTQIWFIPSQAGRYGSAFVGYDDLVVQGGMNEAGLFFDALGVREVDVPATSGKPTYTGQNLAIDVMAGCESVACVIEQFRTFSMDGTWNGQYLFGDRFGDSAIIEPLTVIPSSGHFQVATNFFQSEVPPSERTDERYVTATALLASATEVSADQVRDVLEATHQEGTVNTVYSTVYDLRARVVDLYYFGDFSTAVTFDVADELAKGVHGYELGDLFPLNKAADDAAAPIQAQLAAALARHEPVSIEAGRLAELAGTYEVAPGLALFVAASEGRLRARLSEAPWVDLAPVSASEFVRVFSDSGGFVHEQSLRFGVDIWGTPQVEVRDEQGGSIVAVRSDAARFPFGSPVVTIGIIVIAAGGVAWLLARRHGWRARSRPRVMTHDRAGVHPQVVGGTIEDSR